jgi:glucose-1-phosphate adenylyltransferase
MELIKTIPDFNLYEDFWKIYTNTDNQPPQYTSETADVKTSLISEGCEIYGNVVNSVLGTNVVVEEGATVKDSIIMESCIIGKNSVIDRSIIDQNTKVGAGVVIGEGENTPNEDKPKIYNTGITVIGSDTSIPDGVKIGKNCVIKGIVSTGDFVDSKLESGKSIIVGGEKK